MSIKIQVIKSVVWSAFQGLGNQVISLIIFFVLARLLTPEEFGLVAIANVFLAAIQIFLEQGFAQALIQRQELELDHLDTAFWTSLGLGILMTIFCLITANRVANFFGQPRLTLIIQWLSLLCLLLSLSQVQQAILERKFAFKTIAIRLLVGTLSGGFVGLILAFRGFGAWSLVGQQIVQATVGTLVLWVASDWRPRWQFSHKCFQELWNFGVHILGYKIINFFNERINDFLIGYFLGVVALGYYTVASRILAVITQVVVKTIQDVSLSTFSRLQQAPEKLRQVFYQATQFTSLVAFPIFSGLIIQASDLITTFFGQQWLPAIAILQILSLAGFLRSVTYFSGSVLMAMNKPLWWLQLGFLKMILNLIGFTVAYPWGLIAVSWAYVIRLYLAFPLGQIVIGRLLNLSWKEYLCQFKASFLGSLVMVVFILTSKNILSNLISSSLTLLLMSSLIGTLSYVIAIYLLAPHLVQQLFELGKLATSSSERKT